MFLSYLFKKIKLISILGGWFYPKPKSSIFALIRKAGSGIWLITPLKHDIDLKINNHCNHWDVLKLFFQKIQTNIHIRGMILPKTQKLYFWANPNIDLIFFTGRDHLMSTNPFLKKKWKNIQWGAHIRHFSLSIFWKLAQGYGS